MLDTSFLLFLAQFAERKQHTQHSKSNQQQEARCIIAQPKYTKKLDECESHQTLTAQSILLQRCAAAAAA